MSDAMSFVSLAASADAEAKAADAQEKAEEANTIAHANQSTGKFIVLKPVKLVKKAKRRAKGFFENLFGAPTKEVLSTTPWTTVSVRTSDIQNLTQHHDDDKTAFVRLSISKYAKVKDGDDTIIGLYIPGTIEEVTKLLNQ